jgi:hypothetical protein
MHGIIYLVLSIFGRPGAWLRGEDGRGAYYGDGRGSQVDREPEPPGRSNATQHEGEGSHRPITQIKS